MRSPERKGTVPSLAMSVPSNDIRMSPSLNTSLAGDVGSTRLMYTPFCPSYFGIAGQIFNPCSLPCSVKLLHTTAQAPDESAVLGH